MEGFGPLVVHNLEHLLDNLVGIPGCDWRWHAAAAAAAALSLEIDHPMDCGHAAPNALQDAEVLVEGSLFLEVGRVDVHPLEVLEHGGLKGDDVDGEVHAGPLPCCLVACTPQSVGVGVGKLEGDLVSFSLPLPVARILEEDLLVAFRVEEEVHRRAEVGN